LKTLTSDNSRTKLVALGIGNGSQISLNELNSTASEPTDRNVFQIKDISSINDVEDQLRDAICSGWY